MHVSGLLAFSYLALFLVKPGVASFSLESLRIQEFSIETPYVISQIIWLQCMLIGFYLRQKGLSGKSNKNKYAT